MRLRDAIADMGDTEGLQVHRSWWVATSGVDKVIRAGRSAEVLLKNGATVPVARDMLPRLRELRWL
jgi:DNA-binding LytR/AlgR family response regulator